MSLIYRPDHKKDARILLPQQFKSDQHIQAEMRGRLELSGDLDEHEVESGYPLVALPDSFLYWPMDAAQNSLISGQLATTSVGPNAGNQLIANSTVASGHVIEVVGSLAGKTGVKFDGHETALMRAQSEYAYGTSDLTFCVHMKIPADEPDGSYIIGHHDQNSGFTDFAFAAGIGDDLYSSVKPPGVSTIAGTLGVLTPLPDIWYSLVFVVKRSSTVDGWVNDAKGSTPLDISAIAGSSLTPNSSYARLSLGGRYSFFGTPFCRKNSLDELIIFKTALTDDQIRTLYQLRLDGTSFKTYKGY